MKKAILGTKLGMTQIFKETGEVVPVTVVKAGPCTVVRLKSEERDGYKAVVVGFGELTAKRAEKLKNKPTLGIYAARGVAAKRHMREFRLEDISSYNVGDVIKADIFAEGDIIDVIGKSKGKGTVGPIARHNLSQGFMSHGSKYHRGLGSMGSSAYPGKVFKNKKMAGRVGNERITVQNLTVAMVDAERDLILVRGALPGANGSLVTLRNGVKA